MITAMPANKEQVNRVSGIFNKVRIVHCVADGTVTVYPRHGTLFTLAMSVGEDYMFEIPIPKSIKIETGTFTVA